MGGVYASFLILLAFEVKEVVLLLGTHGLLLMGTWSYHRWPLYSLLHKFFPQMAPIVKTCFAAQAQGVLDLGPVSPVQ